jgi:hypothetical protein
MVDHLHVLVLRAGRHSGDSREADAKASAQESDVERHRCPDHRFLQLDVTIWLRYSKSEIRSRGAACRKYIAGGNDVPVTKPERPTNTDGKIDAWYASAPEIAFNWAETSCSVRRCSG